MLPDVGRRPAAIIPRPDRRCRPALQPLEDRLAPAVITVDDDPGASFFSIGAAVAFAQPGDTIKVAPGQYNEAVLVNKPRLTIQGSFNSKLGLAQRAGPGATPAKDSIVDPLGPGLSAFTVTADHVTITGFNIRNATNDNDSVGITLGSQSGGAVVRNNAISQQSIGLFLGTLGFVQSRVDANAFVANNTTGANGGTAIYADAGVSNVSVTGNYFTGQLGAAMNFNTAALGQQTNLTIQSNTLLHDAAIVLTNVINSTVSGNLSEDSVGDGVTFGGGVMNVRVTGNTLREGEGVGINLRSNVSLNANSNNIIRGNFVSGFRDSGIRVREGGTFNLVEGNTVRNCGLAMDPARPGYGITLEASSNNIVRGNSVRGNTGYGIFVSDSSNNDVRGNTSATNSKDGIRVEGTSSNNLFRGNTAFGNLLYDAEDLTVGGGTAGTANTWQFNTLTVKNPAGLL